MQLSLRDYQSDTLAATQESFRTGHRRPLVVIPCGGGKTVMFASMAQSSQARGKTVWFLVHRRELLDQTVATFERFGIERDTIHIGMVGTVANNIRRFPEPDFIIFDEGHHASAATWRRITNAFPEAYVTGLTATPCRLDGKPLGTVYDDLIVGITARELIDQGYLAPYRYFAPAVTDLSALKRRGADYNTAQAAEILSQRAVFGDVIRHYQEHANGLQAICYCATVEHSERMAKEFQAAGINAVHFDGRTKDAERREIIQRYRDGEIQILCNCELISEGFDVPDCHCCILLRPTVSTALFIQQSMRALRPQPGKTAIILDHVNNYQRHGLPDDDREWSLSATLQQPKEYGEDGRLVIRECPKCFRVYKTAPACPYCGYKAEYTNQEIQNMKEIRLEEVKRRRMDAARRKVTNDTKLADCRTLAELQEYAKQHGYKPGWAWYIWQSRRKAL